MPYEKDFYKKLIDNLYDGVYFVDRDRRITYWNKGLKGLQDTPPHKSLAVAVVTTF